MLFIGTNSLAHELISEYVFDDFYKNKNLFDLSDNPKDAKFFDPVNEIVIGKMKGASKRKQISKFFGTKLKMHCVLLDAGKEFNTAIGVKIAMKFNEYKDIF